MCRRWLSVGREKGKDVREGEWEEGRRAGREGEREGGQGERKGGSKERQGEREEEEGSKEKVLLFKYN